jgi:hypothetical protein
VDTHLINVRIIAVVLFLCELPPRIDDEQQLSGRPRQQQRVRILTGLDADLHACRHDEQTHSKLLSVERKTLASGSLRTDALALC